LTFRTLRVALQEDLQTGIIQVIPGSPARASVKSRQPFCANGALLGRRSKIKDRSRTLLSMTSLGVSLHLLHRYTSNNSTSEILHDNLPCNLFHEAPSTSHAKPLTRSRPITTAGIMSESSEHSRQHQADPLTPTSSISTPYSAGENLHALPQLLTKAALLEHSLQQQLAFIDKHNSRHSQPAYSAATGSQFAPRYKHTTRNRVRSFDRPSTIRGKRSLLRTCSLDRSRYIQDEWPSRGIYCNTLQSYPVEFKEDTSVLDRDPQDTTSLWRDVRAMTGRMSSLPVRTRTESSSKKSGETTDKKIKAPSPYDNDFVQRVLNPRSIKISRPTSGHAPQHFQVDVPSGDRAQYYAEKRGAPPSSVWLESSDDFVVEILREYDCMTERELCEAEFASYAREMLLKRERRIRVREQDNHERGWRAERMIELVAKPGTDGPWIRPPLVEDQSVNLGDTPYTDYGFDLRPDCAYWLSLQAFSPEYKSYVGEHTLVLKDTITCPYLTIEFKRDNSEQQAALNQIAAASALALYNRFLLRKSSLELRKQKWDQQHLKPLKHYGITFTGSQYSVWCIRVQVTKKYQWSGCVMERVCQGTCRVPHGVRDLIDWINEIHCWGLTVNGPECQNDVKSSIRAKESSSGIRVSEFGSPVATSEI